MTTNMSSSNIAMINHCIPIIIAVIVESVMILSKLVLSRLNILRLRASISTVVGTWAPNCLFSGVKLVIKKES